MHSTVDPDARRPAFQTFLLLCGIIGAALFGIINISLSAANPDYILIRQPLGDLELMSHGWIQSADFILLGLFNCAFALGLRYELRGGFGQTWIPLAHVFTALGCTIVGVFIYFPMHAVGAAILATSLITGFCFFTMRFKNDPRWKGWVAYTAVTTILIVVLVCLFTVSITRKGPYTGIIERGIMIVRGIWLIIFSIRVGGGVRLTTLP